MSKKFKNKPCAYCLKNPSTRTGDHVFAREFFAEDKRDNLPKVPACEQCNNEKAKLEHYLTALLPFGGKHSDASMNLTTAVPDRLAKNLRLHRQLAQGREQVWVKEQAGLILPSLAIPFDGTILDDLFRFITRGLLFYHWGVLLGENHDLRVINLTEKGQQIFAQILNMNAQARIVVDLGRGTFHYEGAQAEYPEFTVWRFRIYGGLMLAGDLDAPDEISTGIGVISAKREFFDRPAIADLLANGQWILEAR